MGAPHGPLEPYLENLKEMMSYFRLPPKMFNELKSEYDGMPPPRQPLDLSKQRKEKPESKLWPLLSQYNIPARTQKLQPQQQRPEKPPVMLLQTPKPFLQQPEQLLQPPEQLLQSPKKVLKPPGSVFKAPEPLFKLPGSLFKAPGSVFKVPEPFLKPQRPSLKRRGSILNPQASLPIKKSKIVASSLDAQQKNLQWPQPIGYKDGTLMFYGSVKPEKESSDEDTDEDTDDDESADVDVVGFTDDSEEDADESSDDADDGEDSEDEVDAVVKVEEQVSVVNMVIKPDPDLIEELAAPLAQNQQYQGGENEQDEVSDDTSDYSDDDTEFNAAEEPYDDDYLNDEGFADETDEDEEYNMMDHVQFPINPSYEIARIVQSDLNRREALERIVAYL